MNGTGCTKNALDKARPYHMNGNGLCGALSNVI